MSPDAVAAVQEKWDKQAGLMTYFEAVKKAIASANNKSESEKKDLLSKWSQANSFHKDGISNEQQRKVAQSLGFDPYWCWEKPRTNEGYYRIQGGLEYGIVRGVAFAAFADLVWMETKTPNIHEVT